MKTLCRFSVPLLLRPLIPPEVIPQLAAAIARMQATERLILDPARAPGFDFAAFAVAWAAFEAART